MKKNFLRKLLFTGAVALGTWVNAQVVNITDPITANTTWTSNNTYLLIGEILVKDGATLTIEPGTVIKGDKNAVSRLVITRTGKINAQGTAANPIVFTSNQPAGQEARGDWAGIAIYGNAPLNTKDAQGNSITKIGECGTAPDYEFGGANADDSSGVLSYVRIEYAGYICGTNTELNSLSLGGVGRKTVINHIQVLYSLDDAIELWGGNVNIDHFLTFSTRDDDFDTDNGWSGKAQFGLIVRDPWIVDAADLSNGFESDNDDVGSFNTPYTSGTLSNITVVGPSETFVPAELLPNPNIGVQNGYGARIRRNSAQSIFNSIFVGFNFGVFFEGDGTKAKATEDTLEFKNNIVAGCSKPGQGTFESDYLADAANANQVFAGNDGESTNEDVKLTAPFSYGSSISNYVPQASSPALGAASFSHTRLNDPFFQTVTYVGAFGPDAAWLQDWTTSYAKTPGASGINKTDAYFNTVNVFPNPANNKVNLVVNSKTNMNGVVEITDINGKLLYAQHATLVAGENNFTFNTQSYATGLYIVRLIGNDFAVSRKVSIVK